MQTDLTENVKKAIEPKQGRRLIMSVQELEPLAHEYRTHLRVTAIYFQLSDQERVCLVVYDL